MNNISRAVYKILKILSEHDKPIGSGTISSKLDSASEATIGRMLRDLDKQGFTEKSGFQGRIITDRGRSAVQKFQENRKKEEQMQRIIKLSQVSEKKELIDILITRRAIERETARLAASNITEENIKHMKKIIESNKKHHQLGLSGAEEDVKFHKYIARIADNNMMKNVLDLIRKDGQLSPVLEYMRKEVGGNVIDDHEQILKALINRNPEQAEKSMLNHINNVIKDVNKYWQQVHQGQGDSSAETDSTKERQDN